MNSSRYLKKVSAQQQTPFFFPIIGACGKWFSRGSFAQILTKRYNLRAKATADQFVQSPDNSDIIGKLSPYSLIIEYQCHEDLFFIYRQ